MFFVFFFFVKDMQQISRREIMSVEKGVLKVLSKKIVMEKSSYITVANFLPIDVSL